MAWYDKNKSKKSKPAQAVDRFDTCCHCGNTFNWRLQGTVNGNKEYFCNDVCLRENYLKNVRDRNEAIPFDAL